MRCTALAARLILVSSIGAALAPPAAAATRTWIGGDNNWNSSGLNWTGLDEPDDDDDVVFNTNNHVEMAIDNEILSLNLSGGIELDTETYFLDVNGDVTLSGAGTILRVGESNLAGLPPTSLSAENVTVGSGATFANVGFTSIIDASGIGLFAIEEGGTLLGHGLIRNGDGVSSPAVVLQNDGVIRPGTVSDGFVIGGPAPTARTLTLAAIDGDGLIDLDGASADGAVDINRNQTLDIDMQLSDNFDGVIDLAHNATLDIAGPWGFSGVMNVATGSVPGNPPFVPAIPAGIAFLRGGAVTMSGAPTEINVLDEDGTLEFNAPFTANGGTINNNGRIVFNEDATINAGVDFRMSSVEADMTVGPGATVTINDADMDFDGGGAATNEITVEAGGQLTFNLDSFEGNDRADGYLTLNSGSLSLNVADGSWTMERRLTMNNTGGGAPELTGSAMVVGDDSIQTQSNDADVRVEGTGVSQILVPVTWNSDAELDVAAGATLSVAGFSTFNSVNGAENALFSGPGDVFFAGGQVNEATVLNFSGGTVGLHGGAATVIFLDAPDFTIDAPLTINAAAIDDYGRRVVFPSVDSSELTINALVGGRLEINLDDPSDSWTIDDVGIVNALGQDGAFLTFVDGADVDMNGELNVDGFARSDARLVIGATGVVNFVDANANLRLRGGDLVSVNRIEGGQINSGGALSAPNDKALYGYGVIAADIDFDGADSELRADDGTLTLSGAILDVGEIGTADDDGVLDVTGSWTLASDSVAELLGGELTGGTITNEGLIVGRGLVSARVINNSVLAISGGGTLVVETAGNNNDWDGAGGGSLRALGGGVLELRDNNNIGFSGEIIANGGTVETVGFALNLNPLSTLSLTGGGVYRSTQATDFGGAVEVSGAAASTLDVDGARFVSTSMVTLGGDLRLEGNTQVEQGATFTGGGALVNTVGQTLTLLDGADVDVLVQNRGRLALGASPGQTSGRDFEQTASGVLEIELQGTGLNLFDRMALTGLAQLAGELEVSLIGGFNPALGDAFTILTAAGVAGAFAVEDFALAPLAAGLAWDVVYNAANVQLLVIESPLLPGDYNGDGLVDSIDYAVWRESLGQVGAGLAADGDGSGVVDSADFAIWQENYGASLPASGSISTPEPTTLLLALFVAAAPGARGLLGRRRSPMMRA